MSRDSTKRDLKIQTEFKSSNRATVHGGQMAVNALAGEWGLWDRVREDDRLAPRTHQHKGYDPVICVAALLFGFTTGGDSLAEVERLEDEETLKHLCGEEAPGPEFRRRVDAKRGGGRGHRTSVVRLADD